MESGKLELDSSEVNGVKESPASYKPLPEDDVNTDNEDKGVIKMSKVNSEGEVDEAQERMLNSNKEAEVKFISENGDTKINIEPVKQTLAGMGKEELMKFAKDPFWVRLRWIMFIAFWFLWAAMLAGAIAIIVMAPKCPAPPPRMWWEESPIVRVETSNVTLKGLESLIDNFETKHIRAIGLAPIMQTSSPGMVINFTEVQEELGTIDDLKNFISAAKKKNQRVILELDPSHTSNKHPWFQQSVQKKEPYTNYYLWANCDPNVNKYPNNWVNMANQRAWKYNGDRNQCYLNQFGEELPELNFRNATVVDAISDVLKYWLNLGVSGFRLKNIRYLLEDAKLENEIGTVPDGSPLSNQQSLHTKTRDLGENINILREWRQVVNKHTNGEGLFTLQGNIEGDTWAVYNENSTVHLPQSSKFLNNAASNITAAAIEEGIKHFKDINHGSYGWPGWDLNGEGDSLRQRTSPNISESLTLMMMLLPGTPILSPDDLHPAHFAILSKVRSESAAFLHGKTETHIMNGTVFVYTRFKSGAPAYLVAYQSGTEQATIDLSSLPIVPQKVTVVAHSDNYIEKDITLKSEPSSNSIPMSPKSTLVVTFAPKIEKDN